ncbi:hypothetical protein JCM8208_000312 [Rhodotorula glutinis]
MVRHDSLPVELDTISPAPPSPALSLSRAASGNPFDTPLAKSPASSIHRDPSPSPSGIRLRSLNLETGGEQLAQEQLPPVDGGRGAWAFVVAAFILETVIWGFSFSFATILVYLQRTAPWSDNSIGILSAIGAVNLGTQYLLPLPTTILFRRYPDYVKMALWISTALYTGSMLLSSWATQAWQLVVLQGIVCGATGSIMYTPVLMWLNDWWVAKKGLAGGIIFAGAGIGGLIFPFIISSLLSWRGFPWMVRIWAVLAGTTLALSVYLIKPRVPPRKLRSHERGPWLATDGAFLRDPIMVLTLGTSFVSSLSTFPVSLYLATYASNLTPSAFEAEIVVGIYNVASSFGCAFTGWLADIDYPLATTFCGVAGAIAAFASWGLADSLAKVYGFAVLSGFTSQIIAAWSGCARDVSGGNPYTGSLVFGVLAGSRGLASIAMPFISEELYRPSDEKETWGRFGFYRMMLFVGVTAAISALGGVALKVVRTRMVKSGRLRA